jgi:gas vesicle protein
MNTQKTLLSFVIGAAAGVAAGMLLAPNNGKDTRRKIVDSATSLKNDVGTQLGDTLNKFSELTDSALATLTSYTNKAEKAVNAINKIKGNKTGSNTPTPTPDNTSDQV